MRQELPCQPVISANFSKAADWRAGGEAITDADDDDTPSPHSVKFQRFASLPHNPPEEMESEEAFAAYERIRE